MNVKIARWIGRGLCIALFILWGAFFIEHLSFLITTGGEQPPLYVWLLQLVHGLLLTSYLISIKFERIGSMGILAFGLIFFLSTGAVWYLLAISLSPILFFAYGWIGSRWMTRKFAS